MKPKAPPTKTLVEILNEASEEAGMNWCEVARQSGVTRGGIAKILSKDRVPSSPTLLALLRSMGQSAVVLDQWKLEDAEV